MVASGRQPAPSTPAYVGLRLSADEFLRLAEDGFKYHLINGVAVMSPSPSSRHQAVLAELLFQLSLFVRSHPDCCVLPDIDVRFAPDLVHRPDLIAFSGGRRPTGDRVEIVPDLIVEVLSPSTEGLDLRTKAADYARHGVREYWAVDPTDGSVRVHRPLAQAYAVTRVNADHLESTALPGFRLDLCAIRAITTGA